MYTPIWIKIPAGKFWMGSDPASDVVPYENEIPRHRVHVDAFQLARTHVTNAQYAEFVRKSGYQPPGHWLNGKIPEGLSDHPVTYVDWHDALAFCQWTGVRLPTEAEWEKAARSDDARLWPWGNHPPDAHRCNFAKHIFTTSPVHTFLQSASPYGALDMAGNVWEWTADGFPGQPGEVALRGGGWGNNLYCLRTSYRHGNPPDIGLDMVGFRCAGDIKK